VSNVLEAAFPACPECSAPWRLHWIYVRESGELKRRWNTCDLTRTQLTTKWIVR
jgi:hypothetical protein